MQMFTNSYKWEDFYLCVSKLLFGFWIVAIGFQSRCPNSAKMLKNVKRLDSCPPHVNSQQEEGPNTSGVNQSTWWKLLNLKFTEVRKKSERIMSELTMLVKVFLHKIGM